MSVGKLIEIREREIEQRRRSKLNLLGFSAAVLVVTYALMAAAHWIASAVR